MRTWHLAQPMSTLAPLEPGQSPNAWSQLTSLDNPRLPSRGDQVLSYIDGAFVIDRPGEWCFEVVSDDGSQLWVTGTKVIDNDGLHAPQAATGCKTLEAGTHAFQVKWFQQGGGALLTVRWKGPGDGEFSTIPLHGMQSDWPAQRPTDDGEKRVPGSSARRRAGDGRPLEGVFPNWRVKPIDVKLDGTVVGLQTMNEHSVVACTDAGSIWFVDLHNATAWRHMTGLPMPVVMESTGDGDLLISHAKGTFLFKATDGDGRVDAGTEIHTYVKPGPQRLVDDGALRSKHGTVIADIDASTGIDRLLCEFEAPDGNVYVLLGAPDEVFGAVIERIEGRERATMMRMSAPGAHAATVVMPRGIVLSSDDGLQLMEESNGDALHVKGVEPMANGLRVALSEALARDVLSNPQHYEVMWIDAVGERTELQVASASPLFDGRGAFLQLDQLPIPGTAHVRFTGPWRSLDGDVLWSPEAWASVHAPLPARAGTVVPQVRPRHNDLSPRQERDGWTRLFDGRDAARHWRGFKKDVLPAQWRSEDGELVYTGDGGGDIITREQFDDFELSLDWMVEPGGNSGIFFNVAEDGGAVWATGPEVQILDNARHPDGRSALTSAGANYALHAAPFDASLPPGRWNRARIRVDGDHVQHWLNGVLTADYHLQSPAWKARVADSKFAGMPRYGTESSGHIALQDHGDRVAFRNIRIKRLGGGSDE